MKGIVSELELTTPASFDETLALLSQAPGEVRPLAGGTDVMVVLAAGGLTHRRWVDIRRHSELQGIEILPDRVVIGALTTYSEVQADATLTREFPMLGRAAALSGAWAIQNRGTLGGNIINASPAADSPPALLAYDAQLVLVSSRGERRVDYRGFHTGYKQVQCQPDELIRAIIVPRRPWLAADGRDGARALHAYRKVGTRKAQAISKVCLAALGVVEDGNVKHIRMAFGSVSATPLDCTAVQAAVQGTAADATLAERIVAAVAGQVTPIDDVRSTAAYRIRVAQNLARDFAEDLCVGKTGSSEI